MQLSANTNHEQIQQECVCVGWNKTHFITQGHELDLSLSLFNLLRDSVKPYILIIFQLYSLFYMLLEIRFR